MSRPLPRYLPDPTITDPLEAALAQRQARIDQARQQIINQAAELRQPLNPRGWPIAMRGVGGTSPGTDPYLETERRNRPRRAR